MPTFNAAQLATYSEARALRDYLNSTQQFAANPILPGDDESNSAPVPNPNFPWLPPTVAFPRAGIYLPTWTPGPHADPEPNADAALFLHFRYANGKEGLNVGLAREKFKSFPNSPSYVLDYLATEAA